MLFLPLLSISFPGRRREELSRRDGREEEKQEGRMEENCPVISLSKKRGGKERKREDWGRGVKEV